MQPTRVEISGEHLSFKLQSVEHWSNWRDPLKGADDGCPEIGFGESASITSRQDEDRLFVPVKTETAQRKEIG
jgi:hypothetical protein